MQVGLVRRHDPAHLALRRALLDGAVGRVRLLRSTERGAGHRTGLVASLDGVAWLLGEAPVEVRLESDEPALVTVRTAGGLARIEVDDHTSGGHQLDCAVLGSTGTVGLAAPPAVQLRTPGRSTTLVPPDATARFADATRVALTAWVRSVRTGRAIGAGVWDLHVATTAAAAVATSRATGGAVAVDPGPRPSLYDAVPHRAV